MSSKKQRIEQLKRRIAEIERNGPADETSVRWPVLQKLRRWLATEQDSLSA